MAEQAPAIQSKRLLVVALVLAGIVVVIYNVHITQVRKAGRGKMIDLLQFRRDIDPGETVTKKDIRIVEVDRINYGSLGNVVTKKDFDLVVGSVLNQSGRKNEFVKYGHVTADEGGGPARKLGEGMVAVSLEIDPRNALGDILRVYDRVNILARLSVNRQRLKTYRVIRAVRVMAVGGRGEHGSGTTAGTRIRMGRMPRSYRSITVEIPEKISLQLANVLSHRAGSIWIELCRSGRTVDAGAGQINPELKSLAEHASPGRGEGSS
ncbi:MAG: hypothetical protein ISS78_04740 [Phycisphaerae bacterium]|nr:hypothetical protein [Phycisphaerae bacterium]